MTSALCPDCASEIGAAFKACPACGWLVHGEKLKSLSASAKAAEAEGRLVDALSQWREALEWLPPESRQYEVVKNQASQLSLQIASTPSAQLKPSQRKKAPDKISEPVGIVGAGIVILLKMKTLLIGLLAEAKLLLLGLGKGATLGSMLLSLGVYSTVWNWKFAGGLILGLYIHEMGHVWMMRRFGMRLEAPLFIPGLGAFVQLKQRPLNRIEDARIGIAGPIWGTACVLVVFGVYRLTHLESYGTLAHFLAWITIFNLVPVWQLDGSRAFQSVSPSGRWIVLAVSGLGWAGTREGLFAFLALITLTRLNESDPPQKTDRLTGWAYLTILILSGVLVHWTPSIKASH